MLGKLRPPAIGHPARGPRFRLSREVASEGQAIRA
jgi:hypothetical protein